MATDIEKADAAAIAAAQQRAKTITAQDIMSIDSYIKGLEDQITLLQEELDKRPRGEATDHVWSKFTHPGMREEISAGVKRPTMEQGFDDFFAAAEYAFHNHGVVISGSDATRVPSPTTSTTSSDNDIPDLPAGAPQPKPETGQAAGGDEEYVVGQIYDFICYRLVITPPVIGGSKNAKVDFYTDKYHKPVDQYTFMTSYGTPDKLAKIFSAIGPWEEKHFQVGSDQMLKHPFKVFWKQSAKLNTRGGHFKDLERLEPIK